MIVWWDAVRYVAAVACLVVAASAAATIVQPMLWHQRCRIGFAAVISFAIIHGQLTNLGTPPMSGPRTIVLTIGLAGFAVGMVGLAWQQHTERNNDDAEPDLGADRFANIPVALVVSDVRSRIITAAGNSHPIFGWRPADLIGRPVSLLIPEDDRAAHIAGMERLAGGGRPRFAGRSFLRVEALHRDGHTVPVSLVILPVDGARYLGVIRLRA